MTNLAELAKIEQLRDLKVWISSKIYFEEIDKIFKKWKFFVEQATSQNR